MRIIKFRGKTPDGIWVYGQYAGEFDNSNVGGFRGALILAPYATIVEPLTVGQFTGITDKNGKDIYEGDIMNDPTSMCVGVVEWNSILCQFQLSWQNMHTAADLFFMVKCGSFVIGNIHDNPELLKGGIK